MNCIARPRKKRRRVASDARIPKAVGWGDGNSGGYYLDPGSASHDYTAPGTYTGDAVFSYDDGTYDSPFTEVVSAAPVTFDVSGGGDAEEGQLYLIDTTFDDPSGNTPAEYTVDWGDGSGTDTYDGNPDYGGTFGHKYDPESDGGTDTIQVVASSLDGTFTASMTVDVTQPDPTYSFTDTGEAENGVPFYLYGTEGPADASYTFSYTVHWGDGDTDSDVSGPTLSHEYSFDASPGADDNGHEFTVVASTDSGWTGTYTGSVQVNNTGEGGISITSGDSATVGVSYTLTVDKYGDDAGQWVVDWGDGSVSPLVTATGTATSHYEDTHEYDTTGTYTVEVDALSTVDSYSTEVVDRTSITVSPSTSTTTLTGDTPTLVASGDTTATVVGDTYTLSYTWYNLDDEPVAYYTVAWGDGTSDLYYGGGGGEFTHVYKSASETGTIENPTISAVVGDPQTYKASVPLDVFFPDMHILKSDGTAMDIGEQRTVGGYVSVDPYPTHTTSADPALLTVTFDEESTTLGGNYELTWNSGDFRVWSDVQKSYELSSGYTFQCWGGPLPPVFIEGRVASGKIGADQLTLSWSRPGHIGTGIDTAGINVLGFSGASDVPAYGTYTYKISSGPVIPGDLAAAVWDATGGTADSSDHDSSWASIAWNDSTAGAGQGWLGTPILEYDGFDLVAKLVNVVNIVVSAPTGLASPFAPGTPKVGPSGKGRQFVYAGTTSPGLAWAAQITLNGPENNGTLNAGINDINVGFIQVLTGFTDDGTYGVGGTTATQHSNLDTLHNILDTVTDNSPDRNAPSAPWYFYGTYVIGGNTFASSFRPSGLLNNTATISMSDTPVDGPPESALAAVNGNPNDKMSVRLQTISLLDKFNLYVAAATVDTDNEADKAYAGEASASWTFNGSATYDSRARRLLITGADIPPTAGWQSAQGSTPATELPVFNQLLLKEEFA